MPEQVRHDRFSRGGFMPKTLILLAVLLFLPFHDALACGESFTGVPLSFSDSVKTGEVYSKDITQNYYFASGFFGQNVKVTGDVRDHIYFWLVPRGNDW